MKLLILTGRRERKGGGGKRWPLALLVQQRDQILSGELIMDGDMIKIGEVCLMWWSLSDPASKGVAESLSLRTKKNHLNETSVRLQIGCAMHLGPSEVSLC